MWSVFAILVGLGLVLSTVLIHYEVLRGISLLIPKLSIPPRGRILVVIGGVLVAHMIEICLYAIAYGLMHDTRLGFITGEFVGEAADFLYFSISAFTTLGIGDVHPMGPMRLVAGIEALNGFALIGWSASFTYLAMEKFWDHHRSTAEANREDAA
jgi:hypothetical protein